MTATAMQCEGANVFAMLLMLLFHGSELVLARGTFQRRLCMAAVAIAGLHIFAVRGIVFLTIMHQIMGMMSAEAAVRALRQGPLVLTTSLSHVIVAAILFIPNLLIVAGETAVAIRECPHCRLVFFDEGLLEHFSIMPFYQKQHAILHAILCILILSIATSFRPRWRHSPAMQQARILVEPASLVGVATILFTHHHGTDNPELASHPMIGTLMCICAGMQVLAFVAHQAVPTEEPGALVDVTKPLPLGTPPIVRLSRAALAYAYLVLAYFLYADTYMEYLGCREVMLKKHLGGHSGDRAEGLGLSPESELSTYVAFAVMGAALALACMIIARSSEADEADEELHDRMSSHALLPSRPPGSPKEQGLRCAEP